MKFIAVASISAMLTGQSLAQVFVCKEPNGNTTYSGTPCGTNQRIIDQNTLGRNNLDYSAERRENARSSRSQRAEGARQEAPAAAQPAANLSMCPTDLEIRNLRVAANSLNPSRGAGYKHAFTKRVQAECYRNGGDVLTAQQIVRVQMEQEDEAARPLNCIMTHPGGGICH